MRWSRSGYLRNSQGASRKKSSEALEGGSLWWERGLNWRQTLVSFGHSSPRSEPSGFCGWSFRGGGTSVRRTVEAAISITDPKISEAELLQAALVGHKRQQALLEERIAGIRRELSCLFWRGGGREAQTRDECRWPAPDCRSRSAAKPWGAQKKFGSAVEGQSARWAQPGEKRNIAAIKERWATAESPTAEQSTDRRVYIIPDWSEAKPRTVSGENRGIRLFSPIIVRSGSQWPPGGCSEIAVVVSIWTIDALQTFAERCLAYRLTDALTAEADHEQQCGAQQDGG